MPDQGARWQGALLRWWAVPGAGPPGGGHRHPESDACVGAAPGGYTSPMPAVPEQFWLVGADPRPLPVSSVTPSTIYLSMGDEVLELDRAAFVDDGEIRLTGDGSAAAQLAVSEDDAVRRARDATASELQAVEQRIGKLRDSISELEGHLDAEKRARKRLRKATQRG